jgi:hypothetical protein
MTESVVAQFAALLAETEDGAEREALIKRARIAAMNQAKPEAFEPPVVSLGEYLANPIEVPPSVVGPTIVVRGELTATLGRAGKGKTTFNLNRLIKWSAGRPLFDSLVDYEGVPYLLPEKPLRTLIIENEGSAGMFHHKMGMMVNNSGDILSDEDRELIKQNFHIWGDGGYSGLKLDDPTMLSNVRAGIEKVEPDIVFVEPFRSLWKGEENSSTEMANMVDALVAMATDYQCGVIISHHERKSGAGEDGELMSAGRGSTVLEGVVAVMENFQSVVGGDFREVTWSKARYLQPPPVTRVEYDKISQWYRHVPNDELETEILHVARNGEGWSVKELAEETGESDSRIRATLKRLVDQGSMKASKVAGSNEKKYRVPSGGGEDGGGLPV